MQITVNLPDKLTAKVQDKWENLPQEILRQLSIDKRRKVNGFNHFR